MPNWVISARLALTGTHLPCLPSQQPLGGANHSPASSSTGWQCRLQNHYNVYQKVWLLQRPHCKHTHTHTACFPELENTASKRCTDRKRNKKNGNVENNKWIFFLCHPAATKSKEQSFLGQWELMYADLALTDDMNWLMCSSAVMCRLAQSPFLCLWGRRVLPSLIPRCAVHKCCAFKGLNIQMLLQFLPPCSSPPPTVFNAVFIPQWKSRITREEKARVNESNLRCWNFPVVIVDA